MPLTSCQPVGVAEAVAAVEAAFAGAVVAVMDAAGAAGAATAVDVVVAAAGSLIDAESTRHRKTAITAARFGRLREQIFKDFCMVSSIASGRFALI